MFDFETASDKLAFFAIALSTWCGLFFVVNNNVILSSKVPKKEQDDIRNRIISIMHGLFALFVSGYHIYNDNPKYSQKSTPIQHVIIITSGSYFLYDTIACIYYGLTDMSLFIHHGMTTFGCLYCEIMDTSSIPLIGLFWAEISNAPMHVRVILRTLKMRYTVLFEFAESFYIITYIVCRGIFCTYLAVTAVPDSESDLVVRLLCLGLWSQSMYFIYQMFSILKKKIQQFIERKKKNIEYFWFSENPEIAKLSYFRKEDKPKIF